MGNFTEILKKYQGKGYFEKDFKTSIAMDRLNLATTDTLLYNYMEADFNGNLEKTTKLFQK